MPPSQTYYAPSGNPIRCYTFDNVSGLAVIDEMGNGNAAIINDPTKITVAGGGVIGNCLSHIGSDGLWADCLDFSDISTWMSISMWARFPISGSKIYELATNQYDAILSRFADNTMRRGAGGSVLATITDSNFHNFIFSWSSDTLYSIYIDGTFVGSGTWFRGNLQSCGGHTNSFGYRAPEMDIIQIYDIELTASDASALFAMQALTTALSVYLEQHYDISKIIYNVISEQLYHIIPTISVSVEQLYSFLLETWAVQPYGDVPEIFLTLVQAYKSTPTLNKSLVQPWADALQLETALTQTWAMPGELSAISEQRYGIAAAVLLKTSEQLYHINANTTLFANLSQPYSIAAEAAMLYYVDTKLFVSGVATPYLSMEWQDGDEYALSCDITLAGQDIAARCQDGVEIRIDSAGESWFFQCVGGWRLDKRFASEVYHVSGLSRTCALDEGQRLLGDIPSGMASQIVADLAAPYGITVDWQMADGYLPPGKISAADETALAIIGKIVWDAKGKIMSTRDGNLLIVCEEETPVPDWPTVTPAATIVARLERVSTSEQHDKQPGYNRFIVSDQTAAGGNFNLEYQEVDPYTKEVRLFITPIDGRDFYLSTSGGAPATIEPFGVTVLQVVDELVEFKEGTGNTQRPIYGISAMSWLRDDLGAIQTFTEAGILTSEVAGYSLLKISYDSRYHKWLGRDQNIETVQFIAHEVTTT